MLLDLPSNKGLRLKHIKQSLTSLETIFKAIDLLVFVLSHPLITLWFTVYYSLIPHPHFALEAMHGDPKKRAGPGRAIRCFTLQGGHE